MGPKFMRLGVLVGGLACLPAAQAQVTIGNPIVATGLRDGAITAFVLSGQGFGAGAIGLNLAAWSFYSGDTSNSLSVTPLLLEFSSGYDYILRGVGATITNVSAGAHTDLPFNVVSGSAEITSANFYFGWKDTGGAVIDLVIGGPAMLAYHNNGSPDLSLGSTLTFDNNSVGARTYSVSATAVAIPEPAGGAAMAGLGVLGLVAYRRRQAQGGRITSAGAPPASPRGGLAAPDRGGGIRRLDPA